MYMKIPMPGDKLVPTNEPRLLTREEIAILREDLRVALTVPLDLKPSKHEERDGGQAPNTSMSEPCSICGGALWVCEAHPEVPWIDGKACCGEPGIPCQCNPDERMPPGFVVTCASRPGGSDSE
jgi:hypothetical protein